MTHSAIELAQNDKQAQAYVWHRLRDLRALQVELGPQQRHCRWQASRAGLRDRGQNRRWLGSSPP